MRLRHLGSLGMATILLQSPFVSAQSGGGQRPLLVIIHGRGQPDTLTENALASQWFRTLDSSLRVIGAANTIRETDRAFVWYADLIREGARLDDACIRVRGVPTPDFLELLDQIRQQLTAIAGRVPGLASTVAQRLTQDTYRYFSNERVRCSVDRRLAAVLARAKSDGRPLVIVAHSMGSLVTFSVLLHAPGSGVDYDVSTLITAGSQVGVEAVRKALLGTMTATRAPLPPSVREWLNFSARGDPLAFPVAGYIDAPVATRAPHDVAIDAPYPDSPHDMRSYLSSPQVARAILAAWCSAFRGAERAEACPPR
jgi:pimeloyl-ACP methyl ester carboxylesterase